MDADRLAYTPLEAAQQLGIGRTTFFREVKLGRIATVRVGRRTLATREALVAYLELLADEQRAREEQAAA